MTSYNKFIALGNLTRSPEAVKTGSGKAMCKFGIAVNDRRGDEETTMFIDVVAFGKSAETLLAYAVKGKAILFEGRIAFKQWTEGEVKRSKHEYVIETFKFMPGGNGSAKEDSVPAANDDDLAWT